MKNLFYTILLVSCSSVRGVMYLGFDKKIRINNSIFQLHTNTSLGRTMSNIYNRFFF